MQHISPPQPNPNQHVVHLEQRCCGFKFEQSCPYPLSLSIDSEMFAEIMREAEEVFNTNHVYHSFFYVLCTLPIVFSAVVHLFAASTVTEAVKFYSLVAAAVSAVLFLCSLFFFHSRDIKRLQDHLKIVNDRNQTILRIQFVVEHHRSVDPHFGGGYRVRTWKEHYFIFTSLRNPQPLLPSSVNYESTRLPSRQQQAPANQPYTSTVNGASQPYYNNMLV